jgi:hypothetical protein
VTRLVALVTRVGRVFEHMFVLMVPPIAYVVAFDVVLFGLFVIGWRERLLPEGEAREAAAPAPTRTA